MPKAISRLGRIITWRCLVAGPLIVAYLLSAVLHLHPQASASSQPAPHPTLPYQGGGPKKSSACHCSGSCGGECCCSSASAQKEESDQEPAKSSTGLVVFKTPTCAGTQSFWLMLSAQIMPIPPVSFCLDVKIAALETPAPAKWISLSVSPLVPPPRIS